ncbi:hypothetical protein [Synechococcus sp. MIT S9451]|uniref:hypothetical protein n=1 Tax=Synechococcus sp. MIT S9451 TaxID=3082543 RepID=UPI0039B4C848
MPNVKTIRPRKSLHRLLRALKRATASPSKLGTKGLRASGIIIIAILIGFIIFNTTQTNTLTVAKKDHYEAITRKDKENAYTQFTIGIFIQKISAFDPQTKTFAADGYAWVKWKKPVKAWDEETQADPARTLEFLNAVEHWDFTKELSPEDPYTDSDGWTYQSVVFSGRFLANDIDLRRFPFESITLPIEIESDDFWLTELVFETDHSGSSGISQKNALQGYTLNQATFKSRKHIYPTAMGLNADAREEFGSENIGIYPNFITEVSYTRNFGSSSWQLLLPLGIVSSVAFLTPMIDARAAEAKIALPASVILTLVFLQDGYKQMLPPSLSYLTLLDKFYIAMYVSALAVFGITICYANKISRSTDEDKPETAQTIRREEAQANFAVIALLCIFLMGIWASS